MVLVKAVHVFKSGDLWSSVETALLVKTMNSTFPFPENGSISSCGGVPGGEGGRIDKPASPPMPSTVVTRIA